jgi:hypothetical protein
MVKDPTYAFRLLRKSPDFTLTAVPSFPYFCTVIKVVAGDFAPEMVAITG